MGTPEANYEDDDDHKTNDEGLRITFSTVEGSGFV
jgi:hypothetical protein